MSAPTPTPTSTTTPAPAAAPQRPSTARIIGYAATVAMFAVVALVVTVALTDSWVWAVLACAVAGRASVIILRLAGVPNPLTLARNRR